MKWFKVLAVLALLLFAVSAGVSVAWADGPDGGSGGNNPNARVGKIVPFSRVTSDLPESDGATAASGCKTYTQGVDGYSYTGTYIWSYSWNIYWCYNGSTVSSLSKWRTVWTNLGWSFKGDIAENQSGGNGQWSYWHYAQGDFCFVEYLSCVAHSYPWVNQTAYGNGTFTGSSGGN